MLGGDNLLKMILKVLYSDKGSVVIEKASVDAFRASGKLT
jgi:hypothetical protein